MFRKKPQWHCVADVDACPPGSLLAVMAGDTPAVLANVDGTFYALRDRCSHADYPLSDGSLDGDQIECMYHGARFDLASGRARCLPAIRPVRSYPTEVRESAVFVLAGK